MPALLRAGVRRARSAPRRRGCASGSRRPACARINNIVDVTNYVMLEIGQPMHAFDLAQLAGGALVVRRRAAPARRMRTLDGIDRALDAGHAGDRRRRAAQSRSAASWAARTRRSAATTTMIVLESAYFEPASVRRTSKRLGLKTEASTRFERGADVNAPPVGDRARRRAARSRSAPAQPLGPTDRRYPAPRQPLTADAARVAHRARARAATCRTRTCRAHPRAARVRASRPRATAPEPARGRVTVPTFRVDVLREVDLIEEVGAALRLSIGCPTTLPGARPTPQPRAGSAHRARSRSCGRC